MAILHISILVEYDEDIPEQEESVSKLLPAFEELIAKAGLSIEDSYTEEV